MRLLVLLMAMMPFVAREIGCTATRCHNLNFSAARWIMQCPNGCFSVERHRRKSGLVTGECKSAIKYVPANMGIEGLFELNAASGQLRKRALLRLAKPQLSMGQFCLSNQK